MMIIDSQVHIWEALPASKAEEGERPHFTTDELLAEMDAVGVAGAILVPRSFAGANNDYAIAAATRHPDRLAVMGRMSLNADESRPLLERWTQQMGMLGVRLTFHRKQDRVWLTDGTADWFWPEAERLNIPVMVHAPEGLTALAAIAGRHPGLRILIDHMGFARPDIDEQAALAVDRLLPLAERPNIFVKVSCAPVYSTQPFPYVNIQQQIRRVVDGFGSQRCFWGSDLTRLPADAPYKNCLDMFTQSSDFLSADELADVMGNGLARCLGWQPGSR